MKWRAHFTAGMIGALILRFIFGFSTLHASIFLLWSILIDIDHIFLFIAAFRQYSVNEWMKTARELSNIQEAHLYVFHSPEANLILFVMTFFFPILLPFFLSNVVHLTMDIIAHYSYHKNMKWAKAWSIILNI